MVITITSTVSGNMDALFVDKQGLLLDSINDQFVRANEPYVFNLIPQGSAYRNVSIEALLTVLCLVRLNDTVVHREWLLY